MKHLLSAGLLMSLFFCSGSLKAQVEKSFKQFKNEFSKVKEGFWLGKTEVSNRDYHAFLEAVKTEVSDAEFKVLLPDTLVWRNQIGYSEPMVKFYFSHPAYQNYPVVGVSYEAALAYCKWLNMSYASLAEKKQLRKGRFRLLTPEEWKFAAQGGDTSKTYPWGTGFVRNNRGNYLANFKHDAADTSGSKGGLNDRAVYTSPVNSFFPNSFGAFNMSGNVAELVLQKGVAMGGSYLDPAYNVRVYSKKTYTSATADIGFRVAFISTENEIDFVKH